MLAGDTGVFILALGLVLAITSPISFSFQAYLTCYFDFYFILLLTNLVFLFVADLSNPYRDYRRTETISRVLFIVWLGLMAGELFYYLLPGRILSLSLLEWQALVFGLLLVPWRYLFSVLTLSSWLKRRVLIIGAGKSGKMLYKAMQGYPQSGFELVGFIDDNPQKQGTLVDGLPVLGDSSRLEHLIEEHKAEMAVLAITHEKSINLLQALNRISFNHCQLTDMPSFYEYLTGKIPLDYITEIWLFSHNIQTSRVYYRHFKRLVDVVAGGIGFTADLAITVADCRRH